MACDILHRHVNIIELSSNTQLNYLLHWLQAVILARCTGAITVSSIKTLKNLLGTNPEWLEPAPHVGPVHDGGFLGLEVPQTSMLLVDFN